MDDILRDLLKILIVPVIGFLVALIGRRNLVWLGLVLVFFLFPNLLIALGAMVAFSRIAVSLTNDLSRYASIVAWAATVSSIIYSFIWAVWIYPINKTQIPKIMARLKKEAST